MTLVETKKYGEIVGTHQQRREVGDRNPQHVLGQMLGDVIVAMAPDDAANVLQALITRLDVLEDESLKPFGMLAILWRAWQTRGVVASDAEGYCLSAVECLAAGVPLASTRVGVVADVWPYVGRIPQPACPADIASGVLEAHRLGVDDRLRQWVETQSAARMAADWRDWLASVT